MDKHPTVAVCRWMQSLYLDAIRYAMIESLASSLKLTADSLARLGIGWSLNLRAYTFPMMDGNGWIIGFRTRHGDGAKRAVPGSASGLFIPETFHGQGPLVICEGPTDTAAMLGLGYDAIGRPSCNGGTEYAVKFAKWGRREVWIIADADNPGMDGATALATRLVAERIMVKVFSPPRCKDARAWIINGATRSVVDTIAQNRDYWRQAS